MTTIAFLHPIYGSTTRDTFSAYAKFCELWGEYANPDWRLKSLQLGCTGVDRARNILTDHALRNLAASGEDFVGRHASAGPADLVIMQDADISLRYPQDYFRLIRVALEMPRPWGLLGVPAMIRGTNVEGRANILMRGVKEPASWYASNSDRIDQVGSIGFGLVAIRSWALLEVEPLRPPAVQPPPAPRTPSRWFTFDNYPDGSIVGEDAGFCDKLSKLGILSGSLRLECSHTFSRPHFLADGAATVGRKFNDDI